MEFLSGAMALVVPGHNDAELIALAGCLALLMLIHC